MIRAKTSESTAPDPEVDAELVAEHRVDEAAEVTMTPAERSNSPPIISMPTPTATMPMVEAW